MTDQSFSPTLGARTLHDEEIKLSLPTFPKLLDQIETIRKNAALYRGKKTNNIDSRSAFLRPQIINNLSILGPRGSGKSSILKTLYYHLETEKSKNVLLPPIVPENLESHMTLMSTLLGLLNDQVKLLKKQFLEKRSSSCPICPPEKDLLEKEYRQLVECYVHLQKPYQDISIQTYSTDSDYVRTMSNVFAAGSQFSWRLWNFIDLLLERREQNEKCEKDALLFVFIDDIDLSTYRCSDVVRTLLGYISHPRVVTILAGDINVFGEALTLDFLRQEELLGKDGIRESYTISQVLSVEGKNLLDRKKELAYEYLKKVMPPMNRHSISIWTLSNRGRFRPVGLYNSADGDIPSLQMVLAKTNKFNDLLSGYFSDPKGQEQATSDQVLYHIFDSTARGLINCYISLEQMVRQWDSKEERFKNMKFTLETIVSSNSDLNAFRDLIFSRFLQFGTESSSTSILFNNFNDWIGQQLPYLADYSTSTEESAKDQTVKDEFFELETRVFQIFVYLDWAARLLDKDDILNSEDYETAKKKALFLLCANGFISEKTEELPAGTRKQLYKLVMSNFNPNTYTRCTVPIVFRCFFSLSFPLAVRYFRSFDVSKMLWMFLNEAIEKNLDKLQRAVDFINVLNQFYSDDPSGASVCLAGQPEMLELIESQLKRSQDAMLVSVICSTYFKNYNEKTKRGTLSPIYWQYCKNGVQYTHPLSQDGKFQHTYIVSFFPNSIDTAIEESEISKSELEDYLKALRRPPVSTNAYGVWDISPLNTEELVVKIESNPNSKAELCCAGYWHNLFKEDGDFSGATPIYNFYSEHFWKQISDDSHRLKPLANTYAEPSQRAKNLCDGSTELKYMEQRLKILFAIDSSELWTLGAHDIEDESPTRQIKEYILRQLKTSECNLIGYLRAVTTEECKTEEFNWPLISVIGAKDAFNKLKNAYTGRSYTLADKCIRFLEPIFKQKNTELITVSEYIYVRCVLLRLIRSTAWYGKVEARDFLTILDQASLNLPMNHNSVEVERYTFWFHCYCRYQVAELSDETYTLIEQASEGISLIQDAEKNLDQQNKNNYRKVMEEKGRLEDELIQQIPDLFA